VQQGMREFHDDVHLLPNACDPVSEVAGEGVPAELEAIDGPIIGYVGNLSSRIDIELLDHVAATRRDWNIVLVGSAHAGHEVMRLNRYPNVFLLGPKPAHEAERYIRAFDVAVIPHLDNDMTRAMNPLKAYVYCALGVPVVSTAVANMAPMDEIIKVAHGKEEFVASVEEALREGRRPLTERQRGLLLQNSWEVRAERALEAIDEAMGVRERPSEPVTAGTGGGVR